MCVRVRACVLMDFVVFAFLIFVAFARASPVQISTPAWSGCRSTHSRKETKPFPLLSKRTSLPPCYMTEPARAWWSNFVRCPFGLSFIADFTFVVYAYVDQKSLPVHREIPLTSFDFNRHLLWCSFFLSQRVFLFLTTKLGGACVLVAKLEGFCFACDNVVWCVGASVYSNSSDFMSGCYSNSLVFTTSIYPSVYSYGEWVARDTN